MLASTGYIYPVSPHRQAAKAWHYKLNVMSSLKLDQVGCFNTEDDKTSCHMKARSCECFDLYKVLVPYEMAWTWQKSFVRTRKVLVKRDEDLCDTLIMLQHHPVYTLGTRSSEKFLKFDINNAPYSLYQTERGGEVTYHGPGQILAATVPAHLQGSRFPKAEKELLNYLLTSLAEHSHVKLMNSLEEADQAFLYWAQVAWVLGMNQFRVRSDGQLKQKVKDDKKKKTQ